MVGLMIAANASAMHAEGGYDSLLKVLAGLPDDTVKVHVLNKLVVGRSEADSMLHYAKMQRELSIRLNYHRGIVSANFNLADTYFFLRDASRMEACINEGYDALKHYYHPGSKRPDDYFTWKLLVSRLHRLNNEQEAAVTLLLEAREEAAAGGNASKEAELSIECGLLFSRMEHFERAVIEYRRAAQLLEGSGDLNRLAHTRVSLAIMHYFEGELDVAEDLLMENLALGDALSPDRLYYTKSNLANLLLDKGEVNKAIDLLRETSDWYGHRGDRRSQLTVNLQLTDALMEAGALSDALVLAREVAVAAEEMGELQLQMQAFEIMVDIHQSTGDYRKALSDLQSAGRIRDKWQREELISRTLELEQRFESERKEEEIARLSQLNRVKELEIERNAQALQARTFQLATLASLLLLTGGLAWFLRRQQVLRQQKLEVELEHKALRAQMNPHFIFNALNSIQRMYVEGDLDRANDYMADFSTLMRNILEQTEKRTISLGREVETLRLYLELEQLRMRGKLSFSIDCDASLDLQAVHLPPLVVQPFVENAIWHGILPSRRPGNVCVEFRRATDGLHCIITDDGVGFKEGAQPGHVSRGVAITEQRLGAKVTFSVPQHAKRGTRVEFIIPIQT